MAPSQFHQNDHPADHSSGAEVDKQLERLRSLRPKLWIVDCETHTITATSYRATDPEGMHTKGNSIFKEPYVFDRRILSRVADEKGAMQPLLEQFDADKQGLRMHADVLKLLDSGAGDDERFALLLTDPPTLSVCIDVKYNGQAPDEPGGFTRIWNCRGVTLGDVLEGLRSLSMLGGDDSDVVQDIVVTEGDVIWVTSAEKEEVETQGDAQAPRPSTDYSDGWLVLTEVPQKSAPSRKD